MHCGTRCLASKATVAVHSRSLRCWLRGRCRLCRRIERCWPGRCGRNAGEGPIHGHVAGLGERGGTCHPVCGSGMLPRKVNETLMRILEGLRVPRWHPPYLELRLERHPSPLSAAAAPQGLPRPRDVPSFAAFSVVPLLGARLPSRHQRAVRYPSGSPWTPLPCLRLPPPTCAACQKDPQSWYTSEVLHVDLS